MTDAYKTVEAFQSGDDLDRIVNLIGGNDVKKFYDDDQDVALYLFTDGSVIKAEYDGFKEVK